MVSSFLQCATHINLGWRIRVVDSVEEYVANNEWPDTSTCPDLPPATNATSETTEDSDTSFCPDLPTEESSAPPLSVSYLLLLLVFMNMMF